MHAILITIHSGEGRIAPAEKAVRREPMTSFRPLPNGVAESIKNRRHRRHRLRVVLYMMEGTAMAGRCILM